MGAAAWRPPVSLATRPPPSARGRGGGAGARPRGPERDVGAPLVAVGTSGMLSRSRDGSGRRRDATSHKESKRLYTALYVHPVQLSVWLPYRGNVFPVTLYTEGTRRDRNRWLGSVPLVGVFDVGFLQKQKKIEFK